MNKAKLLAGEAFRYHGGLRPITGSVFYLNRMFGCLFNPVTNEWLPVLSVADDGLTLMKSHLPERKILYTECTPITN